MGFLDRIKFWKHEPHIDLDSTIDTGFQGTDIVQNQNLGLDPMSSPMQNPMQSPSGQAPSFDMNYEPVKNEQRPAQPTGNDSYEKNLEIVSMKLDNLKVAIENVNQRLINIERIAIDSQGREKTRRQW